jgi:hypothetical protein
MNPVLLKPETDTGAQVIVQGRRLARSEAADYGALKGRLMGPVLESFTRLKAAHDLVIVEGAGSPAEVNLRARDIANMGFAEAADVPVVLAGDIDRGGVIAQIVGTQAVLDPSMPRGSRGSSSTGFAATRGFSTMAMHGSRRRPAGAASACCHGSRTHGVYRRRMRWTSTRRTGRRGCTWSASRCRGSRISTISTR